VRHLVHIVREVPSGDIQILSRVCDCKQPHFGEVQAAGNNAGTHFQRLAALKINLDRHAFFNRQINHGRSDSKVLQAHTCSVKQRNLVV